MLCTFDAGMGLFGHHFACDPIVPGALLLDWYAAYGWSGEVGEVVRFSEVRFHRFVRPGSPAEFTTRADGGVQVRVADELCCAFGVDHGGSRALPPPPAVPVGLRTLRVAPLRDPAYWFLGEELAVDFEACWATCRIDLEACARTHAWLGELNRWRPLVLIECAGNLAWAMQETKAPGGAASRYVLAGFDEIDYGVDCRGWSTRQTIVTHLRRHGSLLIWDAWIGDDASTRIVIRGAMSRKEKLQ
jgi:hypothetical protein